MKSRLGLIALATTSLVFGPAWLTRSDEPDEQQARIKELLEQALNWYDVLPDAQAKDRLSPQIVLRWQNPVRVQTGAGLMAIWTQHGRPEAMASIFVWDGDICHEFGSLSRSNKIVARDKSSVVWSPEASGVDFRDVPDTPAPAETPAARLRQMKAIAERFTARLPERNGDSNPEVLRLLPRPLYRYEIDDVSEADPTLKDGGMFAFVMGTDPEVVLLLEAVGRDDNVVWKYAFARATGWAVDASFGKDVVWSVKADTVGRDPKNTQTQIRRPLP
jgi:hypothetical protein